MPKLGIDTEGLQSPVSAQGRTAEASRKGMDLTISTAGHGGGDGFSQYETTHGPMRPRPKTYSHTKKAAAGLRSATAFRFAHFDHQGGHDEGAPERLTGGYVRRRRRRARGAQTRPIDEPSIRLRRGRQYRTAKPNPNFRKTTRASRPTG
jgi:hypothetical protein